MVDSKNGRVVQRMMSQDLGNGVPLSDGRGHDTAGGIDKGIAGHNALSDMTHVLGSHCLTYADMTRLEESTKGCRGLIIMSGVGSTYTSGAFRGYPSTSQIPRGTLYFASCNRRRYEI